MTIFSNLKTTVGNMHDSHPDDIFKTRKILKEIGIEAGEEDRPIIDKPLNDGIRKFQRKIGLKEDGIMKPKGETEQALNIVLAVKEKLPPIPPKKPTKLPKPPREPARKTETRQEDEIARQKGQEQARIIGELGSGLATGRLDRIPVKNKILRQIIDNTVGKGQDLLAKGIEKLFEDHFSDTMLDKLKNDRRKEIKEPDNNDQ